VLVEPTNSNTVSSDDRTVGVLNMDTEAQVVKSLAVADAVKTATGSALTAEQLAKQVTVSVPPNTTILEIGFQGSSAADAQRTAQAFADSYLAFRNSQSAEIVRSKSQRLEDQSRKTRLSITALNRQIALQSPQSAARASSQQTLSQEQTRLRWIEQQLLPLQARPDSAGSVIVSAPLNNQPVKPNKILVGGSLCALFVLLGLIVAWWRDGRDGCIRVPAEIEQAHAVEVLGAVNDVQLSNGESRRRSQQQYRLVVHTVLARLGESPGALLVTGVGANSSGEQVAETLSGELARLGRHVRLVYSDTEAARVFGGALPAQVEQGGGELEALSLAAAREEGDGVVHDLSGYVRQSTENGVQVVLATPPTGISADAQAVSPSVQFTILVVTLDQSTKTDLAEALRQFHQVGVDNLGVVVVSRMSRRERARSKARLAERQRWLEARGSSTTVTPATAMPVADPADGDVPIELDELDELDQLEAEAIEVAERDEVEPHEAEVDRTDSDETDPVARELVTADAGRRSRARKRRGGDARLTDEGADAQKAELAPVPVKPSR
jgi:polysaccharide biosynthesis transport protein